MKRPSLVSWILLALWSTWLHALQGQWAASGPFAPDLGMVLVVVLAARMPPDELARGALAVGLGRCAVSIDPPAAVLFGTLAPALVFGSLRSVVVIREGLARAVLAGVGSALSARWLMLVHAARGTEIPAGLESGLAAVWPLALSTALAALVLGPLFGVLPGMGVLLRRRPWEVAASSR